VKKEGATPLFFIPNSFILLHFFIKLKSYRFAKACGISFASSFKNQI
jgi:hypothetical protein